MRRQTGARSAARDFSGQLSVFLADVVVEVHPRLCIAGILVRRFVLVSEGVWGRVCQLLKGGCALPGASVDFEAFVSESQ